MLRRRRHQTILLDRFWAAIRADPRRRSLPPAGLNPEIAGVATRLAAESRSLAPTSAFRATLRAQIEAASQTTPDRQHAITLPSASHPAPKAAFLPDNEESFSRRHPITKLFSDDSEPLPRRHPAKEWARFIAAVLAFFIVGGLLVALLNDSYESRSGNSSAPATPTTDPALGASIPPDVPVQIKLNSGRPSWGIAVGDGSIWIATVTDDGSAVVRAAQTGRLGGDVQATIPFSGRVWDVAYGHGSVWATVIGDSLTGAGSALVRIDPATNAVAATIPLGAQPTSILIGTDAIWITDLGDPTIWRVDPATNSVAATIPLGESGDGDGVMLATTDDALWALVSHAASGVELVWIDGATNTVAGATMLPEIENVIGAVAGTSGSLWIATATNTLLRFDIMTAKIVQRIELPGLTRALLADDQYLWVATMAYAPDGSGPVEGWRNTLTLIDAPSGRVHTIHDLHDDVPWALAVDQQDGPQFIWVSLNSEADQQARLLGERRPSGISFNLTPPTATTGPNSTTSDASPPTDPSETPNVTIHATPEPTVTIPAESASAGEITATWEFTGGLGQPAWGAGALWTPNWSFGVVERIDAATGATSRIQVSPPGPTSNGVPMVLAADDNAVWVSDNTSYELARIDPAPAGGSETVPAGDNTSYELARIDPATSEIVARVALAGVTEFPAWIESIAVGEGAVWVILDDTEVVVRIDPATNTVTDVIDAPGARSIAVGLGAVWVQNVWTAEILRIDPATNDIVATIPTGPNDFVPMSLATGAGGVWVENGDRGTVSRIDPASNIIVATTARLGIDHISMAAGDAGVWALFVRSSLLVWIDPLTLETRSIEIAAPAGVTLGGGSVWVTIDTGPTDTVVRITPTP